MITYNTKNEKVIVSDHITFEMLIDQVPEVELILRAEYGKELGNYDSFRGKKWINYVPSFLPEEVLKHDIHPGYKSSRFLKKVPWTFLRDFARNWFILLDPRTTWDKSYYQRKYEDNVRILSQHIKERYAKILKVVDFNVSGIPKELISGKTVINSGW